ncbi:MAG: DnaD domain protein, partial [Clostridia bacterium]|nr:DnaD domain protein [Clostridia bacterium]
MKKTENLHIKLNYESAVSVLPSSVIELVDRAKKFDIKVLLLISSSDTYRMDGGIARMSSELGCEEKDVEASLAFWNGAGVIDVVEEKSEKTKKSAKENKEEVKKEDTVAPIAKRVKVSDLPQYTTEELNALLEKHEGICALIDECQQILGKMFNTSEVKILMGLVDHLELDEEYILVLMHYCNEIEKRSLRYV